ncbi:ADP-heptose--LPS heptosyltransferase [Bordetella sputigena]|uniref:glycosyltransferase family 9 protein n=1 Tax=Bordetella sputigena TaxID=1416810 RepID=UPI0039EE0F82
MATTDSQAPIALILSTRLGDSLFMMTIAHNLRRSRRRVVVYGDHGGALAEWFPGFDIRPLAAAKEPAALDDYGAIIQMSLDEPMTGLAERRANFLVIKSLPQQTADEGSDNPGGPCNGIMATFRHFTRTLFGLDDWTHDNGLRAPAGLRHRLHGRRVILHPTSSEPERCWRPDQYVALATALRQRGFDPVFVLAPRERPAWQALLAPHGLAILDAPDLAHTARAIHESGWFIGTDSGIGHLASACGIPTVTIVDRPRNMDRWRPMWAPGLIVRPWWLPLRSMRRAYWREATTVGRTLRAFDTLRRRVENAAPAQPGLTRVAPSTSTIDRPA